MVTNLRGAFHNEAATAGPCIDCHRKENAEHKHKLAPVKCADCHNKANVLPDPTAGTPQASKKCLMSGDFVLLFAFARSEKAIFEWLDMDRSCSNDGDML
jgi:hypothetical protein